MGNSIVSLGKSSRGFDRPSIPSNLAKPECAKAECQAFLTAVAVGLWRRPLPVGEPLPTLPLPLSVHQATHIDLEETYARAAKRAYLD